MGSPGLVRVLLLLVSSAPDGSLSAILDNTAPRGSNQVCIDDFN